MRVCPLCGEQFPLGVNYCPKDGQRLNDIAVEGHSEDPFLGMLLDDRYKIERRLGQGGMGIVYAARHVVIDKSVAIKVLRHEYCRDKGLVQRFIREARAASQIGHPNIVDVTDFGKLPDGHIYFVMEHLVGVTLDKAIRGTEGLSLARVLDLGIQMSHGLAAAHDKGIVHRDLKPENIFIVNPCSKTVIEDRSGQRQDFVKLLDFGIAKFSFGKKTRITRLGSVFGTPQYMSPEQAAGEDADHRGDIYAFGCILYEMVTGEVPFTSDTFMGTLTKQMFETPLAPREVRPDRRISGTLEEVILRMLAKDPAARFQTMREVTEALDACAKEFDFSLSSPEISANDVPADLALPETKLDLRPAPESYLSPAETRDIDASIAALPLDEPREHSSRPLAEPRSLELTEAVPPLHRAPRRTSSGKVALGAALIVGVLVAGAAAWHRVADDRGRPVVNPGPSARSAPNPGAAGAREKRAHEATAGKNDLSHEVWLHTVPQGAVVTAGGKRLGVTPLRRRMPIGVPQSFMFHLDGYLDLLHTMTPTRETRVVIVELQPTTSKKSPKRSPKKAPLPRLRPHPRSRKVGPSRKDLRNPFVRKMK